MSVRTERLGSQIQKDLGDILQKEYQPVGTFVSVTHVLVTDDLSIAKVYLSLYAPGRELEPIFERIDAHQTEIRHALAARIRHQVRRVPELIFFVDDTSDYADRMETLFKRVKSAESPEGDREAID